MGKTQGVNKAIRPPKKPSKKTDHKLLCSVVLVLPQSFKGFAKSIVTIFSFFESDEAATPPSSGTVKAYSEG